MGKLTVARLETVRRARDKSNFPLKRLLEWQSAAKALPIVESLKPLFQISGGITLDRDNGSWIIHTPLDGGSGLPFTDTAKMLYAVTKDGGDFVVKGPEADALESILPLIKTKTSINQLPASTDILTSEKTHPLLRRFLIHSRDWRQETVDAAAILSKRDGVHSMSSFDRLFERSKPSDLEAFALKCIERACDAYVIGYVLSGARLVTAAAADNLLALNKLGVSRVKRVAERLDDFYHGRSPKRLRNLESILRYHKERLTEVVGPRVVGAIDSCFAD